MTRDTAERRDRPPAAPLSDRLSDAAIRTVIGTALRLPYAARLRFMGAFLSRVAGPAAGFRRRAAANLGHVWPELDPAARRRIARAALDNAGRTLIENYAWREFRDRLAATEPQGAGLAALEEARAAGRPVLFVTGHFGNYEAPRQVLTRLGHSIGGLYRPMSNVLFNAHYARSMTETSGPVFESGHAGTMAFARHLKRGGMATMLYDVRDTRGPRLPFLGRPALTSLGAAVIAVRADALVLPYFGTRQPDGISFAVDVEAPVPHGPPEEMMRALHARLEARIVERPGQWFWVHDRWKGAAETASSAGPPPRG